MLISRFNFACYQPAETVRSLAESKRLLEEARREISENRERSQLRTKHTFARLPSFFPRQAEVQAIKRALEGEPSFTVLFGASSVGKVRHNFTLDCILITSKTDRTPERSPLL